MEASRSFQTYFAVPPFAQIAGAFDSTVIGKLSKSRGENLVTAFARNR
jgi:hypothetical protein